MTAGEGDEPVVARVTPEAGSSVAKLLGMPLVLDVWECHANLLVVAAPENRLAKLEQRRLAHVERWVTAADYVARMQNRSAGGNHDRQGDPSPKDNS